MKKIMDFYHSPENLVIMAGKPLKNATKTGAVAVKTTSKNCRSNC